MGSIGRLDWDLYGSMLEESDLSEEQQRELIGSLWSIVVGFVDLGFGIHPVQQVCGEDEDNLALAISDVISSQSDNPLLSENPASCVHEE